MHIFIWEKWLKVEEMCGRGSILEGQKEVGSRVNWLTLNKRHSFPLRSEDRKVSI